jgi:hypothetical protein
MNEAMRAELVRFARRHKYDRDEGFADEPLAGELTQETAELVRTIACELAHAAGVSEDVAESAFLCWTMGQVIAADSEGKLDRGFAAYLREKFGLRD